MTAYVRNGFVSDLDYRIFLELQADGRVPFTSIAERLDVSETYVRRRVAYLTESDFFSITAVSNPRVLGLTYIGWIGLSTECSMTAAIADELVTLPEITYVVICAGAYNLMVEVACSTHGEFQGLVAKLRSLRGILKIESFVYLKLVYQQFSFAAETESQPVGAGVVENVADLQDLDVRLIRELEAHGRAPFRTLAQKLGVSERTVSLRSSQLVENRWLRVMAVANPLTMGFQAMAWLGISVSNGADIDSTAIALSKVSGVSYVVIATGRFDIMAEIVCRSREDLQTTLEQGVGSVQGVLSAETFYYLRLLYKSTAGAWGVGRSLARRREAERTNSYLDATVDV